MKSYSVFRRIIIRQYLQMYVEVKDPKDPDIPLLVQDFL